MRVYLEDAVCHSVTPIEQMGQLVAFFARSGEDHSKLAPSELIIGITEIDFLRLLFAGGG